MRPLMYMLAFAVLAHTHLRGQAPAMVAARAPSDRTAPLSKNEDLNVQAYIQLLRTDLRKTQSQIVSDVMQLDAAQASAFWPVYREFQDENSKIGDQTLELIKEYTLNYDRMNNTLADNLALKLLDIQQQRNALNKKYYHRLKTALDPITAARFLQVENQIENLTDLQIASRLPVVGSGK